MACPVFNEEICCMCQERLYFKTLACLGEGLVPVQPWPRNDSQSDEICINHPEVVACIVSYSSWYSVSAKWISLKIYSIIFISDLSTQILFEDKCLIFDIFDLYLEILHFSKYIDRNLHHNIVSWMF